MSGGTYKALEPESAMNGIYPYLSTPSLAAMPVGTNLAIGKTKLQFPVYLFSNPWQFRPHANTRHNATGGCFRFLHFQPHRSKVPPPAFAVVRVFIALAWSWSDCPHQGLLANTVSLGGLAQTVGHGANVNYSCRSDKRNSPGTDELLDWSSWAPVRLFGFGAKRLTLHRLNLLQEKSFIRKRFIRKRSGASLLVQHSNHVSICPRDTKHMPSTHHYRGWSSHSLWWSPYKLHCSCQPFLLMSVIFDRSQFLSVCVFLE